MAEAYRIETCAARLPKDGLLPYLCTIRIWDGWRRLVVEAEAWEPRQAREDARRRAMLGARLFGMRAGRLILP